MISEVGREVQASAPSCACCAAGALAGMVAAGAQPTTPSNFLSIPDCPSSCAPALQKVTLIYSESFVRVYLSSCWCWGRGIDAHARHVGQTHAPVLALHTALNMDLIQEIFKDVGNTAHSNEINPQLVKRTFARSSKRVKPISVGLAARALPQLDY